MTHYNISDLSQENLNRELYKATQVGDLNYVKYLLTSSKLQFHADPNLNDNRCLKYACQFGHLNIVKYLLNDSNIQLNTPIKTLTTDCVFKAADNNQVAILDYFRNEARVNIPYSEEDLIQENLIILERVCVFGFLETVDYILKNPNVKNYVLDEKTLFRLFESSIYTSNHDLIKYFIFELNLEKSESVNQLLDELSEHQKNAIERLFELRTINKSLNNHLEHNQNHTKKTKL